MAVAVLQRRQNKVVAMSAVGVEAVSGTDLGQFGGDKKRFLIFDAQLKLLLQQCLVELEVLVEQLLVDLFWDSLK